MRKAFQVFLGLFGATDIFISLLHLVLGPRAIPGAIPVNATMDSEDRFYATLFTAYGVAVLWCIKDLERKSTLVYFLAGTFWLGGLARLISIAAVGLPDRFFHPLIAIELVLPPLMVLAQRRIVRQAQSPVR